jgi:hypothetical protein
MIGEAMPGHDIRTGIRALRRGATRKEVVEKQKK